MSHLEQWLRDNRLQDGGVQQTLEPIIQASQLLQARKTTDDVQSICEMCSRLTTSQVSCFSVLQNSPNAGNPEKNEHTLWIHAYSYFLMNYSTDNQNPEPVYSSQRV